MLKASPRLPSDERQRTKDFKLYVIFTTLRIQLLNWTQISTRLYLKLARTYAIVRFISRENHLVLGS
jgi:hypothetical protein